MTHGPISLKRRHVLGDLYSRCERIASIPVFLDTPEGEPIGYVDEGLGHYADAFVFHLPEDICKKLSTSGFVYSFSYDFADDNTSLRDGKRRVRLTNICLTARKTAREVQLERELRLSSIA